MPISSSQSIQCPSKLIKRQYMLRNGLVIIRNYLHVAMKRKSSSRSGLAWPHEYRSYRRVNPVLLFLIRYNSPFVVGGIYGCVSHLSRTILNCGRTGPEHRRRSFGCLIMVGEPVWYDLSRHCPPPPSCQQTLHNSSYVKINLILLISCQAEIRVHELFRCERA